MTMLVTPVRYPPAGQPSQNTGLTGLGAGCTPLTGPGPAVRLVRQSPWRQVKQGPNRNKQSIAISCLRQHLVSFHPTVPGIDYSLADTQISIDLSHSRYRPRNGLSQPATLSFGGKGIELAVHPEVFFCLWRCPRYRGTTFRFTAGSYVSSSSSQSQCSCCPWQAQLDCRSLVCGRRTWFSKARSGEACCSRQALARLQVDLHLF